MKKKILIMKINQEKININHNIILMIFQIILIIKNLIKKRDFKF